jgi:NADP-dependent 3-hydroxy acid dehydrogenase YdfG
MAMAQMGSLTDVTLIVVQLLLLPLICVVGLLHVAVIILEETVFGTQAPLRAPLHVALTGAGSGFGEALALHYAKNGTVVTLIGRSASSLAAVAAACVERSVSESRFAGGGVMFAFHVASHLRYLIHSRRGAKVHTVVQDVRDADGMAHVLLAADDVQPIDLLYANAGVSEATLQRDGLPAGEQTTRALLSTNIDGVLNCVEPLLPRMLARGGGKIVVMSSIASSGYFVGGAAYCASKAAVRVYGESLRAAHWRDGLRVTVACPSLTQSPMTTANPLRVSAAATTMPMARAVSILTSAVARDAPFVAFPAHHQTAAWAALRVIPPLLLHAISSRGRCIVPQANYLPRPRGGSSVGAQAWASNDRADNVEL